MISPITTRSRVIFAVIGLASCNASSPLPAKGGAVTDLAAAPCYCLFVNGSGAHAATGSGGDYDSVASLTVEAWVWVLASAPHPQAIVGHGDTSPAFRAGYELSILPDGTLHFAIVDNTGTGITTTDGVPLGRWVHAAGVYDADRREQRVFIDGANAASRTTPERPGANPNAALTIGADDPSASSHYFFGGYVSDVRISNSARYSSSFLPERRLLVDGTTLALFHLDESSGNVAHDGRSGGVNATLADGARFGIPADCR